MATRMTQAAAISSVALTWRLKDEWRNVSRKEYGYDLSNADEIRPTYRFNETCQDYHQAIVAFLESTDFEDAIWMRFLLVGTAILPNH